MFLSTILILSFFKVASLSVDKCVFFGFSETITSAIQKEVLQMLLKNISKISKTAVPYSTMGECFRRLFSIQVSEWRSQLNLCTQLL